MTYDIPSRTPLTFEEEVRARTAFADFLVRELAAHGTVRFPAHEPEERRRLLDLVPALSNALGTEVHCTPEDVTAMRFTVQTGHAQALDRT
ncbi:hypothetical protein [Streptomyces sp. CA-132043]|uniref:hypothetical protein n=1 Tax=Streptomyces sp. CA-132043 TaxID=3240048 RepID=UPI003D94B007